MKLKDYKALNSPGYIYENCCYESAESLLQTGILGFCGCGNPENNLLYILGGLELINEEPPETTNKNLIKSWWLDHRRQIEQLFGPDEGQFFFYYWADKEGYVEHGSCLPGWLTSEGRKLLELLREWYDMTYPNKADS